MTLKKKIYAGIAGVTFTLAVAPVLIGCSKAHQPKAWVSVEKPPMRVIYIDYEKDISAATVYNLSNSIRGLPYEDYKFNDSMNVNISYDATASTSTANSLSVDAGN